MSVLPLRGAENADDHREKAIREGRHALWPMFRVMDHLTFFLVFFVAGFLFTVDIYVDISGGLASATIFSSGKDTSMQLSVSFYRLISFVGHLLLVVFVVNRGFFVAWEYVSRKTMYPVQSNPPHATQPPNSPATGK